jgi:ribosomal protein S12 methylthiotransferase
MKAPKIYIHPAACPKAAVDLEKIGWILREAGFALVADPDGAAIALVFGCGFIDDAKQESIDDTLALVEMKTRGEVGHVVVIGCLPQKYARALALSIPEVDAFVGTAALPMLPAICSQLFDRKCIDRIWTDDLTVLGEIAEAPYRVNMSASAWTRTLMISDGCNNTCTYCAIPHMRGRLRSADIGSLVEEMGELVDQGAVEVILAAQDTASYGNDLGANRLADLLSALAEEFPDTWLRLAYANPDNLADGVAEAIASYASICNYIDIPIQHASSRILKAMGREGPALVRRKIKHLREAVPDIALRTSLIVGFPGETEEDVARLLKFLESIEFDMAGVFGFSPQPGTPAAKMRGKVPDETASERIVDVVGLQEEISHKKMEAMLGREVVVLVEERDEAGDCLGRSQYDMPEVDRIIRLPAANAPPGRFVKARLESVSAPFEWTARLIKA